MTFCKAEKTDDLGLVDSNMFVRRVSQIQLTIGIPDSETIGLLVEFAKANSGYGQLQIQVNGFLTDFCWYFILSHFKRDLSRQLAGQYLRKG